MTFVFKYDTNIALCIPFFSYISHRTRKHTMTNKQTRTGDHLNLKKTVQDAVLLFVSFCFWCLTFLEFFFVNKFYFLMSLVVLLVSPDLELDSEQMEIATDTITETVHQAFRVDVRRRCLHVLTHSEDNIGMRLLQSLASIPFRQCFCSTRKDNNLPDGVGCIYNQRLEETEIKTLDAVLLKASHVLVLTTGPQWLEHSILKYWVETTRAGCAIISVDTREVSYEWPSLHACLQVEGVCPFSEH